MKRTHLQSATRFRSTGSPKHIIIGGKRVELNDVCMPIEPVFDLSEIIPPPRKFTREELLHLHKLAALEPPTTEEEWDKLNDEISPLAAIIESIRHPALGAHDDEAHGIDLNNLPDGRIRPYDEVPYDEKELPDPTEMRPSTPEQLLELSRSREGPFYATQTPAGVRSKTRQQDKVPE